MGIHSVRVVIKDLGLEDRVHKYEELLHMVNPSNYDLHRRLCWKLAKNYFKKSVVSL